MAHAEREALAEGSGGDEPQLVGDQLDDVSGAQRAAGDHGAEHAQDRPDAVDGGGVPAREQGEPAVAGTIDRPGHR